MQIENATFTPLVLSFSGAMAPECRMFFKQLALLFSLKPMMPELEHHRSNERRPILS